MKTRYFLAMLAVVGGLTACNADMDFDIADPVLSAPEGDFVTASLQGDDYVLSWSATPGIMMQVTRYANGAKAGSEIVSTNTYIHHDVDTNVPYMYILKVTDGKNFSKGVIKEFTRPGAGKCSNITMAQVEKVGGYDATVEWSTANTNATKVNLVATNGTTTIEKALNANENTFVIPDVKEGETWTVTLVAENAEGKSLPISSSLRIGKLAVAFLSEYDTPEEHIANADDDEAYAWLWFKANYPTGTFVPFSSISSTSDLDPYRVMFWIRDLETGNHMDAFKYSEVIKNATPFITEWYKNGGSMLLWSHAITYCEQLGRIPEGAILNNDNTIGTGKGGWNGDTWKMAVQLAPGDGKFMKDHSNHPIYKGLDVETAGNTKLIAMKGAGWTEDHNCLFFNFPSQLTGLGNQDEACYTALTKTFGIIPLGTWDSQINWVSQLNVWEAQQGNTEFQGTLICVGNGGCEFYMKDANGNADVEHNPSANPFQSNVERMAKNAIEYLKTR